MENGSDFDFLARFVVSKLKTQSHRYTQLIINRIFTN